MSTCQQQADYWSRQVMLGRGQSVAVLDPCGIAGIPEGMQLTLEIPSKRESIGLGNSVRITARLTPIRHEASPAPSAEVQ